MSRIVLKRIVMMALLVASIATLSVVKWIQTDGSSDTILRLVNNRKQKNDFDQLFDNTVFKSFTISFDETVFQSLLDDMQSYFDLYGTYQDNTMHPVTMTYNDSDGTSFTLEEVGFRTKSNTSRNLPLTYDWMNRATYHQTSFQLQFDETFDYAKNSNEYAVLKGREAFNLEQLNFEFCKSFDGEYDAAMISEAYAYELYRNAGVDVSHASYGIVYLQVGDVLINYGFFTFIEPIDKVFLADNYKSDVIGDYGDLYKATDVAGIADLSVDSISLAGINDNPLNLRYSYALQNNTLGDTRTSHDTLLHFMQNIADSAHFSEMAEDILDVDQFLRALAMGFLIGNTDDYRYNFNNYYLYFKVYTSKAVFIPFDLDNALGFGKHQDLTYRYGVDYPIFSDQDDLAVLVGAVFSIESYRDLYVDYLESFANELFSYDDFYAEYTTAKALYETVLVSENHLGNQAFGLRNIAWYMVTKKTNVLSQVEEYRGN